MEEKKRASMASQQKELVTILIVETFLQYHFFKYRSCCSRMMCCRKKKVKQDSRRTSMLSKKQSLAPTIPPPEVIKINNFCTVKLKTFPSFLHQGAKTKARNGSCGGKENDLFIRVYVKTKLMICKTLIARFTDEGSDSSSSDLSCVVLPCLQCDSAWNW